MDTLLTSSSRARSSKTQREPPIPQRTTAVSNSTHNPEQLSHYPVLASTTGTQTQFTIIKPFFEAIQKTTPPTQRVRTTMEDIGQIPGVPTPPTHEPPIARSSAVRSRPQQRKAVVKKRDPCAPSLFIAITSQAMIDVNVLASSHLLVLVLHPFCVHNFEMAHCRVCNCIRDCSSKVEPVPAVSDHFLENSPHLSTGYEGVVHTVFFFSLKTQQLCMEDIFLPIAHRLNSLPPSVLCFQTCSLVCELIRKRISHVTNVSPYPSYVKLQFFLGHFTRVTEQDCLRPVLSRHELLIHHFAGNWKALLFHRRKRRKTSLQGIHPRRLNIWIFLNEMLQEIVQQLRPKKSDFEQP